MTMKMSPKGIFALVLHEGIVPAPYLDSVKVWTWGVGHTAAAGAPYPEKMPRGMPADLDAALDEVLTVFAADLQSYEAAVCKALKVPVSQHEFDALVSFHYNTGAIARAEVTRLLNLGDRAGAAAAFMNWRKPEHIKERREEEQLLFAKGIYPTGKATVWNVNNAGVITWRVSRTLSQDEVLERMEAFLGDRNAIPATPTEDKGQIEYDPVTDMPLLVFGARGDEVARLQKLLIATGDLMTSTFGYFGTKTNAAVRAYQKRNGLSVDGRVGPKTWASLLKGD